MSNLGYFGLEFEDLGLTLNKEHTDDIDLDDFTTKLSLEIQYSGKSTGREFKWKQSTMHTNKIQSNNFKTTLSESDIQTDNDSIRLTGLTNLTSFYPQSDYIDLNSDILNELSNTEIVIQVIRIKSTPSVDSSSATAAAIPPPLNALKKSKSILTEVSAVAAATHVPIDEIIFELRIQMAQLLGSKATCLQFDETHTLDSYINSNPPSSNSVSQISCKILNNALIVPSQSYLKFKVYADNDLAEYVYGCCIYQYKSIKLTDMTADMTFHVTEPATTAVVPDNKAKSKPKAGAVAATTPSTVIPTTDVLVKMAENITKLLDEQQRYLNYQIDFDIVDNSSSSSSTDEMIHHEHDENKEKGSEKHNHVHMSVDDDKNDIQIDKETNDGNIVVTIAKSICIDGKVHFDSTTVSLLTPDVNLNDCSKLWTVEWECSPFVFLHRAIVRHLFLSLANHSMETLPVVTLEVCLKKLPTPEGITSTIAGQEVLLNVSLPLPFTTNIMGNGNVNMTDYPFAVYMGCNNQNMIASLLGEEEVGNNLNINTVNVNVNVLYATMSFIQPFSNPFKPIQAIPLQPSSSTSPIMPQEISLTNNRQKDVMAEFRQDIKSIVTNLAQEFLKMKQFNHITNNISNNNQENMNIIQLPPITPPLHSSSSSSSLSDSLKSEFLKYISSSGILHSFKEKLKPRIQQIIYDKYGPNGQALSSNIHNNFKNSNDTTTSNDTTHNNNNNHNQPEDQISGDKDTPTDDNTSESKSLAEVGRMLNEVYIILIQESNLVLNQLFASTMIDHQAQELEKKPLINDSIETDEQAFKRLKYQARNAEADDRFHLAEQYHLERIYLTKKNHHTNDSAIIGSKKNTHSNSNNTHNDNDNTHSNNTNDDDTATQNNIYLHEAYTDYADLYLHRIKSHHHQQQQQLNGVYSNKRGYDVDDQDFQDMLSRCHQICVLAVSSDPSDVKSLLLLACSFSRLGRVYDAEKTLLSTINLWSSSSSCNKKKNKNANDTNDYEDDDDDDALTSLETLLDYTSSSSSSSTTAGLKYLNTVDPVCYCILAGILSLQPMKNALLIRKAILMAAYAYDHHASSSSSSLKPNTASKILELIVLSDLGKPHRTAVLCLTSTAVFLHDYGFIELGYELYTLAISCDQAANKKAQFRNIPSITPPVIRTLLKRVAFYTLLNPCKKMMMMRMMMITHDDDSSDVNCHKSAVMDAAIDFLDSARGNDLQRGHIAMGQALLLMKEVDTASNTATTTTTAISAMKGTSLTTACEHFLQAIHLNTNTSNNNANAMTTTTTTTTTTASVSESTQTSSLSSSPLCLDILIQTGRILIQLGRYAEGISYLSSFVLPPPSSSSSSSVRNDDDDDSTSSSSSYSYSSTLHLIIGICYLRQEQFQIAEKWLNIANILESRNNEIWAYLALVCLSTTSMISSVTPSSRILQAEKCIQQALRLGLKSCHLLREIATSFMSADRLVIAEDLLRLSIANSSNNNNGNNHSLPSPPSFQNHDNEQNNINNNSSSGSSSSHTIEILKSRKLLGTIMSTQNRVYDALEEYRQIVENDVMPIEERISAGQFCLNILKSLDRLEEVKVLERIMTSLLNI